MATTDPIQTMISGPCTCADGICNRRGHVPQNADCGHPGVKGVTPSGINYCHREDCRDRAAIASAIVSLCRKVNDSSR